MLESTRHRWLSGLCTLLAAIFPVIGTAAPAKARMNTTPLTELELRLQEIDRKLENLASFSMRGGVGSVGYRSKAHPDPFQIEWVQVDWEQETSIDEVVLVPTIWRDAKIGFRQDGFPEEFRILAGTAGDEHGTEIAKFSAVDGLLPRIAPLIVPAHGIMASWVRVEATLLSPRAWDRLYDLELSEILVFHGRVNVALHKRTSASSHFDNQSNRQKERLVDGFMPYLMHAAHGDQSTAFVAGLNIHARPTLTFDLGSVNPIHGINLHAVDTSDNVPQSAPSDFGIPRRLKVEGATQPDFSDADILIEFHAESPFDTGPINMLAFDEASCRFIRFTVIDPYILNDGNRVRQHFGFAEIEILSGGSNIAMGIPALANFESNDPMRTLSALTDGLNLYGTILPTRDWLRELALRHELERERPLVVEALNKRYMHQKKRLVWMSWLTIALAAGIILTILLNRILRMRQVARIRERFAADLHDELGADLQSIRLLGELALAAKDSPPRLVRILQSSQEITQRASLSVRRCMHMQEASGFHGSLKENMERIAQRMMAQLDYEIIIEGENFLQRLKPGTKTDLFLFFQECLINISRHSDATHFSAKLLANHKEVRMTISDNGCGLPDISNKIIPNSLKRRARLLGASVTADASDNGGTRITLTLPTRRLGFSK